MATVQIAKEPKVIVPSQTVELRKQDGKRILQMWLADDSFTYENPITHKRFRLNKQALPTIAKTIIGNKYLIPPDMNHPRHQEPNPYDVNVDIERINEAGRPFEAGTFYDIHPQNRYGNDGYDAFVDLDTDLGKRLFDAGLLPRYNSTSILKMNNDEPEDDVKTARINNVCAVKYPNYGIRSSIEGMCVGDRDDCKNQLINNSAYDTGMSAANTSDGYTIKLESCPTMEAIKQLPEDNKFSFDNGIFNAQEITNANMSAEANPATTDATVTYNFPKSGRTVKMDSKGKILSDSHPSEKMPEGFKITKAPGLEQEKPNGEEGEKKPEEGNGDNNKEGNKAKSEGGEAKKNADGTLSSEQQKTREKEEPKKEEVLKEEAKVEEPNNNNDRVGQLEASVKQLQTTVDKTNTQMKYYRSVLIKEKVSRANLKPEQRDEHQKRWEKMDIHGDELEFALNTAYSSQEPIVKAGERKNSAFVDDGTREIKNSEVEDKPKKLTVDLLQRKQQPL